MKHLSWKLLALFSFLLPFTYGQALIGDDCEESSDCVGDPGNTSECSGNTCHCLSGYVATVDKDNCLPTKKLGESCQDRCQCQDGTPGEWSDCIENLCSCIQDTSIPNEKRDKCLEIINEVQGKPCEETQQCTAGSPGDLSECIDEPSDPPTGGKKCFCTADAVVFSNKCYLKAIAVGEICEVHTQCEAGLGRLSKCEFETKICVCPTATSVPNGKNDECLAIVNTIGGRCREDIQCTKGSPGYHSECSGGACYCKDDSVNAPGHHICYEKAELVGDACEIKEQCTEILGERSDCDGEGECSCTPGSVASNDQKRCVKSGFLIGQPCEDDAECVGEEGTFQCDSNICGCLPDFIASNGRDDCLKIANEIGGECREIQQCKEGDLGELSDCFQTSPGVSICNCTEDAITEKDETPQLCRKKAVHVGDPCEVPSQCHANLGKANSECSEDQICVCSGDSIPSTNSTACLLKSFLNDPCEDNIQCNWIPQSPNSASCQLKDANHPDEGSICRCNPDFINPAGKPDVCFPLAQSIGGACAFDDIQCNNLANAKCSPEKLCSCINATHVASANGRACLDRVDRLNSPCSESPQCSPPNSECRTVDPSQTQMLCLCRKDEYIESLDRPGICLEILNETRLPCEEKVQCSAGLGSGSDCIGNFCQCSSNYQYFEGTCYYPVGLEERCNSTGECQVGVNNYAYCDSGRCRCLTGAFPFEEKCFVPKYVGDACGSHTECTFSIQGPAYCNPTTRMCTCQLGYSGSFHNSICSSAIRRLPSVTGILALIFVAGMMSKLGFN